jgi:hypothetical protein
LTDPGATMLSAFASLPSPGPSMSNSDVLPAVSAREPTASERSALSPGLSVPPDLTATRPFAAPLPASVAPSLTVTSEFEWIEPVTRSVPASTIVSKP